MILYLKLFLILIKQFLKGLDEKQPCYNFYPNFFGLNAQKNKLNKV